MATDACDSLQALANSLNGLVDAGQISREHAHNLFAQATADPSNPNQQPHPDPGAFIVPDPEAYMFGNLRSIAEVFAEGHTAVPWLVEDLIPLSAVTLVAAGAKVGKTTMLCSILNAMTTGKDWAGLSVTQGTGWLFTQEGFSQPFRDHRRCWPHLELAPHDFSIVPEGRRTLRRNLQLGGAHRRPYQGVGGGRQCQRLDTADGHHLRHSRQLERPGRHQQLFRSAEGVPTPPTAARPDWGRHRRGCITRGRTRAPMAAVRFNWCWAPWDSARSQTTSSP